ncbi:histidine kinase [Paenibacillus sp. WQ 127069]|uniref:Histidine kinase n=1 Tax=Paenibacillus baimaensis TaxID=2982185 RepID=A0ABT2UFY1_9BACL|nr:sensor histidine kinase [Paenibacillus sp. WQ 127069]MCU6792579.1 histidine kinase [Paenibacillus sp. WQ 127069]
MNFHPNLYTKISMLLLSIVAIPTIILGYLSFNQSNQQIQTMTQAFLLDNLHHNAIRLESLFSRTKQQSDKVLESQRLKALLHQPPPQSSLDEYDFIRQMNPILEELQGELDIAIYPKDPELYPIYAGNVKGNEDWFQLALLMEGQGAWHVRSVKDELPLELLYVRAIRDYPSLQPIGVLTLRVPRFLLDNQFIIPENVERISYYLVEENGRVLATRSNNPESAITEIYHDLNMGLPGTDNPLKMIRKNETDFYEVSRPLDINNWRLAALIPIDEVTGPVEKIKRFTWLLVSSGIIIMSILLLLIVRSVTIPIRTLVRFMRKIYSGELLYCEQYLPRTDEIGQLVRGYNSMIKGMFELIQKTKMYEEEKRKLEIRALIHQLNPHFLYNTMDTIKWKAEKAEAPEIVEMIATLSNLLRFSIHTDEELTTMERELEYVKNYLSLELQRNSHAFSVYYQIDPDILCQPFMKLTIQPIVENAIKHAMKTMVEGTGKIMITVIQSKDRIICSIEDNGPGLSVGSAANMESELRHGDSNYSGVGLSNTDRRLKLRFGDSYGITLENRATGGCKVVLQHPLIELSGTISQAAN